MQGTENDSMWLQKSIALPDPLPDINGTAPVATTMGSNQAASSEATTAQAEVATEAGVAAPVSMPPPSMQGERKQSEMELTRLVGDMSSLVARTQRPSLRYSARMSVSSSALISVQEYDDLRNRYSQAKRDLLRVSDVQRDLDFAKFELARATEELQLVKESNRKLKQSLDEALQRAEKERQVRAELESRIEEADAGRDKEVDFLRRQVEELRGESKKRLQEMADQQEAEHQGRVQALLEELSAANEAKDDLARQLTETQNARELMESKLKDLFAERDRLQGEVADKESKTVALRQECTEVEERLQSALQQAQKEHDEAMAAQRVLHDERVQQILTARDKSYNLLEIDLHETQAKNRQLADELAAARHKMEQDGEVLQQLKASHAKELQRLQEGHALALGEQQVRLEAAVREAKSSRYSLEEEGQSLRRQLAKLTDDLHTTTDTLAQRERQLAAREQEMRETKEQLCRAEQAVTQLQADLEMQLHACEEANERVRRLNAEKDAAEEEFERNYTDSRTRLRSLEDSLMACRTELATLRKEHIESGDESRSTIQSLRTELEQVRAEKAALQRQLAGEQRQQQQSSTSVEDYRHKYAAEKQRADNLNVELCAAIGRCSALERRLGEEQRQRASNAALHSLTPPSQTTCGSRAPRLRSVSSTNALSQTGSVKRARTEDARVFAISGFEGNELLLAIRQLPNVTIAECKSNMPVPSNLTHLVTNGQLTIKLLSALVHGCWILPAAYVTDSLKRHMWLSEADYGFQHEEPPLLKKRIAFTEGFMSCKHFSTASLLVKEGAAVVVESAAEADMVLCTNAELDSQEKGMSWEAMIELIYPVRVE